MTVDAHVGAGAIGRFGAVLDELGAGSVFLVTGTRSYRSSGAEQRMAGALAKRRVAHWQGVSANPTLSEVVACLEELHRSRADVIVGVGGGSAIDTAKLIALLSAQDRSPLEVARGGELRSAQLPVIAIPTTAGSGAEATPFAIFYVDRLKHSLAHPSMLPRYAIVDPELTYSLPPSITAATGLDALSQAIESLWSVHSNDMSSALGREAMSLAMTSLTDAVRRPGPSSRAAMSQAAFLAGKAIAVTRTTAPHALSYAMTANHGVAHGHAVALTLGATLAYNCGVGDADVVDSRGAAWVRGRMDQIVGATGCSDRFQARDAIEELIVASGLSNRLSELGIRTAAERRFLVEAVDADRLGNNPRAFTRESLAEMIDSIA